MEDKKIIDSIQLPTLSKTLFEIIENNACFLGNLLSALFNSLFVLIRLTALSESA